MQVDSIAMAAPLVEELNVMESDGVLAYDAFLNREVLVIAPVLCVICDNYRASEITNHLGPGSRMFCRMCMVLTKSVVDIKVHEYECVFSS